MPRSLQEYKAHRKVLKAQIKETRALLKSLERELEEMRLEMGHEELDHLEEYMTKAAPRLGDLRTLASAATTDMQRSMSALVNWIKSPRT